MIKKHSGLSLLEMVATLMIVATIIMSGLRLYQRYELEADLEKLKFNVDQLFLAMADYYRVNCSSLNDSGGQPIAGSTATLDPRLFAAGPFLRVNMATLINDSFLQNWHPENRLVDNTAEEQGYMAQFQLITATGEKNVVACADSSSPCHMTATPLPESITHVRPITIAVKLRNPQRALAYMRGLNANCLTTRNGSTIQPCGNVATTGDYLAWTRLPSSISSQMPSVLSASMSNVREFNLQYNHDQMYELSTRQPSFYLCGG